MLEIHPQNCHFRHFSARPERLAGGKAGSRNTLQRHEIGHDPRRAGPSQNRVGNGGTRNCHTDFR